MQIQMIPWHVFMNALEQQQHAQIVGWLDRWRFTNDGVFMARDVRGVSDEGQSGNDAANRRRSDDRVLN
ncbi:MAG: hypothetical protein FJ143_18280 [Deltaproteobacteria bacterium]|nr:hypothetical protein [Deltaproteobacteria bacterium]